jgi:hypothetical protein
VKKTALLAFCGCIFGVAVLAFGAADYWDPRLNQICGLKLVDVRDSVAAGQGYWRLTRAEFQDEQEAAGTHHVYYMVYDLNGSPIENQKTWASWPYDSTANTTFQLTKGAVDGYWANFGMSGTNYTPCNWPFNAWIDTASSPRSYIGPSDRVCGMGMTNPNGTAAHAHVSFRLYWRWTIKASPHLSVSPLAFRHTIAAGGSLGPDAFTVSNPGGGTLEYTITDNVGWLAVTPGSGSSSGPANPHSITYAAQSLPLGAYDASITVSSAQADNSPVLIPVTLLVKPSLVPGDMDGDLDVDQSDFGLFQRCLNSPDLAQSQGDCIGARLDSDADVDQDDADVFSRCHTGPGVSGNLACN